MARPFLCVLLASLGSLGAQSPIGSAFLVGDAPGGADTAPAVACEGSTGRYLVVWSASPAGVAAEVRGQLVSPSGTLLGPQMVLTTDAVLGTLPAVAAVKASGRFVVGWVAQNGGAPRPSCVAVDAGTGAISAAASPTYASASPPVQIALGGDSRIGVFGIGDQVIMATRRQGPGGESVRTDALHVGATGAPFFLSGSGEGIAAGDSYYHIALSEHGGTAGRWLLAVSHYDLWNGAFISVDVLNDNGARCIPIGAPFSSSGAFPAVATRDGTDFAVVVAESGSLNVHPMTFSGACGTGTLTPGPVVTVGQATTVIGGVQSGPRVTFAHDEYLLTWCTVVAAQAGRVHVLGLDPASCVACGVEETVELSVASQQQPAIAAQWSGSASADDEALVVWTNGTIRARRCEARSAGTVTSMGGSCGIPGFSDLATYSGTPVLGDTTFQVALAAPTSPVLALVVGFAPASIPCGACTLVPSPDVLLPGISPTPIPIPCNPDLVGAELYTQWMQLRPSGCPLLPGIGLSNCLRFTLGQ